MDLLFSRRLREQSGKPKSAIRLTAGHGDETKCQTDFTDELVSHLVLRDKALGDKERAAIRFVEAVFSSCAEDINSKRWYCVQLDVIDIVTNTQWRDVFDVYL
ncbi:hypothetical protein TNCV_2125971 [Trichonephila clavipes]|nr:hypothetical protein TNCV_2125971 [Trichonephila clavipes]